MELIAHNHCWNAIKVDGLWRLVDCADGARLRGHTRCFFTAPEHFRMVYQPLNAPWSLLRDYISDQAFFSQMWASVRFFKSGCRVLDPLQGFGLCKQQTLQLRRCLCIVNIVASFREVFGTSVSVAGPQCSCSSDTCMPV